MKSVGEFATVVALACLVFVFAGLFAFRDGSVASPSIIRVSWIIPQAARYVKVRIRAGDRDYFCDSRMEGAPRFFTAHEPFTCVVPVNETPPSIFINAVMGMMDEPAQQSAVIELPASYKEADHDWARQFPFGYAEYGTLRVNGMSMTFHPEAVTDNVPPDWRERRAYVYYF